MFARAFTELLALALKVDEKVFGGQENEFELIKEEIKSGEAFQVVLSQRFSMPAKSEPFDLYRVLREQNPSPYMYLFRFNDGLSIVGSSPEALVKVTGDEVVIHPIAGTRPRGKDDKQDLSIEKELLNDPKERAEHLMLVDPMSFDARTPRQFLCYIQYQSEVS